MAIDPAPHVAVELDSTGEFPAIAPPRKPRVEVELGALTHPGRVRQNNEDHFLLARMSKAMRICATSLPIADQTQYSDEEGYLLIVADGMGGAAAGEEASARAVLTVEEFVLNTVKWFLHLGRKEENTLACELRAALQRADRDVMERAADDFRLAGMGTTLTMGYSVGTDLYIVHAGDSRAYLYRDGEMLQITNDHTLVQLLIEGGQITPEQAKTHHRRNVVTNVIGGPNPGVQAEIHKVPLQDGDVVLLCSDGLTEPVDDAQIAEVLARGDSPKMTCRHLMERALQAGGPDNITVIVARYHITPPA